MMGMLRCVRVGAAGTAEGHGAVGDVSPVLQSVLWSAIQKILCDHTPCHQSTDKMI